MYVLAYPCDKNVNVTSPERKEDRSLMQKKRLVTAIVLTLALVVTMIPATAMGATGAKGFSGKSASNADALIKVAKSKIGAPYSAGAAGPNAFDCSGYVAWVMNKCGIKLTRGSSASYNKKAYNVGASISKAKKGDILLFYRGGRIGHCGIYVGNGNVIHATVSGGVRITKWNGFGQSLAGVIRTFNQGGNLTITVKSQDGADVSNRQFKVTKGDYSKTIKTDKNGKAKLTGINTGKYTVKPVNTSDSYLTSEKRTVTVSSGKTSKLTFMHEYKPGSITFTAAVTEAEMLDQYLLDLAEYEAYQEDLEAGVVDTAEDKESEARDVTADLAPGKIESGDIGEENSEEAVKKPVLDILEKEGAFKIIITGPGAEKGKTVEIDANGQVEIPDLDHGEYTVKVVDANGCTLSCDEIFTVQPGENTAAELYFLVVE